MFLLPFLWFKTTEFFHVWGYNETCHDKIHIKPTSFICIQISSGARPFRSWWERRLGFGVITVWLSIKICKRTKIVFLTHCFCFNYSQFKSQLISFLSISLCLFWDKSWKIKSADLLVRLKKNIQNWTKRWCHDIY